MFRIPHFYRIDMTFAEAQRMLTPNDNILDALERVDAAWAEHCASADMPSDDDFYSRWMYEVNAYNVVVSNMRTLFA